MKYLEHTFDELISKSYGYSKKVVDASSSWVTARELFEKNYVQFEGTEQKIPKIIHQIWLGGDLPKEYQKYADTWKRLHPDWQYILWKDEDVKKLKITKKEVYKSPSVALRSDILRYEILKKFGGLYVDTDFECLKPFDDLLNLNFFTGVSYDTSFVLYNGLIASVPEHNILNTVITNIVDVPYMQNKGSIILHLTGAYLFTRCFDAVPNKEGVVAFPMDFFYPYPNNVRREEGNPYKYIQPCSYAIHHWAVSWLNKKRRK
jgi:mannosyltransferase OCH1-like enzyme